VRLPRKILIPAIAGGLGVVALKTWSRRGVRQQRTAQLVGLGARSGQAWALHRARRLFADAERRTELDTAFELRTAEQVAATLGNMKGAMMKIGQMASYLDAALPEPVRDALADLQQDAPPMSGELAAEVVTAELGLAPEKLFAEWDPVPIAAASIGQVHRAITTDGRAVAVKVQYPGISEAIAADLDNAGLLFGGLGMLYPGLEPGPLVDELRARVLEELDYRIEAAHQREFAEFYRDHPFLHVPEVLDELSTRRVLTTELATGARFDEVVTWSQGERDLAGEAIFRFVFRGLYRLHNFNGDPQPGNYLFRPGGQVTFLDFGLCKRFDKAEVQVFSEMVQAMVLDRDIARFRSVVEEVGLLAPGLPFTDDQVEDYFGHFYDFIKESKTLTMTEEFASETVRRMFDAGGAHAEITKAANVPPSFVIIQRINLGLYALLGRLEATANWREIAEELWPFVDGPPSTDLGRAEQAWLATRKTQDESPET
jgi:predicted unusual protein kinase regulating ubiquinone biosynthesis (AarF/ABC1/UbiB family)